MKPHLHIIAFNIPYPPDYGGVIDIFYRIKALKAEGVSISLHCFEYGRPHSKELEELCEQVYYYPRKTGWASNLSLMPYIINSRRSEELLNNLKKDRDPILFEGLHSTYYLKHRVLRERLKIVRAHNIEHSYYFRLFLAEKAMGRKLFFLMESVRLFIAQRRLGYAGLIAAISPREEKYFQNRFRRVFLLNPFHSGGQIDILPGKGEYLLYHANLSVPENSKVIRFLIEKVIPEVAFPFIIAGKNPDERIIRMIKSKPGVKLVPSPDAGTMIELIRNAQANIVISFQGTGMKLKLIESLFHGRHCIINEMVAGESGLAELCETGNTPAELSIQLKKVLDKEFDKSQIDVRKHVLENFRNETNAKLLIQQIENYKKETGSGDP